MRAVSDASPLIALARIGCFDLAQKLFGIVTIPTEVYAEVVTKGETRPGASEVAGASWIHVEQLDREAGLAALRERTGLGAGELSAILLAKQVNVDVVLLDDLEARKLARAEGQHVVGTVGILEAAFGAGHVADLREAYGQLLMSGLYLKRDLLNASLRRLGLPAL